MDNEFGMHDDEVEDIIEKPISRVKVCYFCNFRIKLMFFSTEFIASFVKRFR